MSHRYPLQEVSLYPSTSFSSQLSVPVTPGGGGFRIVTFLQMPRPPLPSRRTVRLREETEPSERCPASLHELSTPRCLRTSRLFLSGHRGAGRPPPAAVLDRSPPPAGEPALGAISAAPRGWRHLRHPTDSFPAKHLTQGPAYCF